VHNKTRSYPGESKIFFLAVTTKHDPDHVDRLMLDIYDVVLLQSCVIPLFDSPSSKLMLQIAYCIAGREYEIW
jgi:hypothetical protein